MADGLMEFVTFCITTAVAIISALFVVFHRNPIVNAVALVLHLCCIAVFFLLLSAPFLAAVQIIVYAGAILVLFLFVVMLLDLRAEMSRLRGSGGQVVLASGAVAGLLALLGIALRRSRQTFGLDLSAGEGFGAPEQVARALFTGDMIAFELASILLLVALVGALMLTQAHADPKER